MSAILNFIYTAVIAIIGYIILFGWIAYMINLIWYAITGHALTKDENGDYTTL